MGAGGAAGLQAARLRSSAAAVEPEAIRDFMDAVERNRDTMIVSHADDSSSCQEALSTHGGRTSHEFDPGICTQAVVI